MPLVNSRELLQDARRHCYAVGAFNVENMEMMQAVVEAAQAEGAPVILQTTPSTLKYADTSTFTAMAQAIAGETAVPVAIHLDHGDSFELCVRAIADGYTSVMIDGSKLPLMENIALARQVVRRAAEAPFHPCVEADLGRLGGKEDSVDVKAGEDIYTAPEETAYFVEQTGIDALAVAIGTVHGFYKGTPKLDFERLAQIRDAVSVPLVLHGTSGVPDKDVQRAISLGICKVNFATELRAAYTEAIRHTLTENPSLYDPKKFGEPGRDAVSKLVRHRIEICGGNHEYEIP